MTRKEKIRRLEAGSALRRLKSAGLCACIVIFFSALFCAAQSTSTPADNPVPQMASDCLHRTIPVTLVENSSGSRPEANQLHVRVGRSNASVLSVARVNIVPRVVLLLDTSASMADAPSTRNGADWGSGLLAAAFALDIIPKESPVALVTFSNDTQLSGFSDREMVKQQLIALGRTKVHGHTALYAALQRSIQVFETPQFGDTIFLISDGGENVGGANPQRVADELTRRGIRVFAFVVNDLNGLFGSPEGGAKDLSDFVELVGGSWLTLRITPRWLTSRQAPLVFKAIGEQLQSPYRIEIALEDAPTKPLDLKIRTDLKHLEISYPHRIEPCEALSAASRP